MNHTSFFLSFFFLFASQLIAQNDIYVLSNAQSIDPNRYEGIDGNPYFFKQWMSADAYNYQMEKFDSLRVNFNGKTGEMEARQGNSFLELDQKFYARIVISAERNEGIFPSDAGEQLIFQQKLHKTFANRWPILVYKGKDFSLIREFSSIVSTKTFEDVGKTIEKKRFIRRNSYFLLQGGKLSLIKTQKKKLLASLKHRSEMERFIKKNKINLKQQDGLEKLFAYYDQLGG
ncbi:MAG: hypothetical protein AAF587_30250 [Bacteroidota bacterium]